MNKRNIEQVPTTTPSLTAERIAALQELIPEAFSEGQMDMERLRAALGDIVDDRPERYSFTWAGKRDAIRLLQTPSSATLVPAPEESVNWDTTQHLFIEGENLEVLKLLYKAYFGKVKLIYIDPPYNTGNDFVYPDDFADPLGRYLEITGQKDAAGNLLTSNPETSGRYHSAWLNMMYPRLFMARQLLREDGAIFISIDDNEVENLRRISNEVFGEENFVATLIWQKVFSPKNTARHFSEDHDYIVVYARDKEMWMPTLLPRSEEAVARYQNPDNDSRGPWTSSDLTARNYYGDGQYTVKGPTGKVFGPGRGRYWRQNLDSFKRLDADGRIWWGENSSNMPRLKRFLSEVKEGVVPQTLLFHANVGNTQEAKKELLEFTDFEETANVLNSVKPTRLLGHIVRIATNPDSADIVLDFFCGSGPLGHAVINLNREDGGNRRFIMVQLPEPLPIPEKKVRTIADLAKSRIANVSYRFSRSDTGKPPLDEDDTNPLGFRVFKLALPTIRGWRGTADLTPTDYAAQMELLSDPLVEGWRPEDVVWEVAIKEGFPLTSQVTTAATGGQQVYRVDDGDSGRHFHICLDDEVRADIAAALGLGRNDLLVVRDRAVDDTTAANLALQCRLKTL